MAVDKTSMPSRRRQRALWITLGLVMTLCAWFAAHGEQDATADIAQPLTHVAVGALPHAHSNSLAADPMRERRTVALLEQALSASSARADFPKLTDVGRNSWSSVEPAVPSASANAPAVIAAVPPTFPFQWVGLWTQPGEVRDGPAPAPMAIIAGPHSTWMVKQGDVLDEDWKIVSLSTDQMHVIHLPTSSRQTISMSNQ